MEGLLRFPICCCCCCRCCSWVGSLQEENDNDVQLRIKSLFIGKEEAKEEEEEEGEEEEEEEEEAQ